MIDRRGVQPLHHHHGLFAPVPVHFGHIKQRRTREVTAQLRAVTGLAHKIEFVMQILVEFGDDFARFQAATIGAESLNPTREHPQNSQIALDHGLDIRTQYFDGDIAILKRVAELQGNRAEVHLRHASAGNRRPVEAGEHLINGPTVGFF